MTTNNQKISATLLAKHGHHTVSAATRKKLSDKFKGRPIPLEQRLRIAKTLAGRHPSAAARLNLSAAMKKVVVSKATRKKMSHTKILNTTKRRLAESQAARIHVPIL